MPTCAVHPKPHHTTRALTPLSHFLHTGVPHTCSHPQGSARDKDKREQERQQLQDLVGKNLTYLSQLDGLGYDLYAGMVSWHGGKTGRCGREWEGQVVGRFEGWARTLRIVVSGMAWDMICMLAW